MNKQITGQPATPQRATAQATLEGNLLQGTGKKTGKAASAESAAFEAQLTQAGLLAQSQPQPLQPQTLSLSIPQQGEAAKAELKTEAKSPGTEGATLTSAKAGVNSAIPMPQGKSALSVKADAALAGGALVSGAATEKTLKTAVSSNTVSAMAGLKPWSKDWVFQGEDLESAPPETPALPGSGAQTSTAKGGEADEALASMLNLMTGGLDPVAGQELARKLGIQKSEVGATSATATASPSLSPSQSPALASALAPTLAPNAAQELGAEAVTRGEIQGNKKPQAGNKNAMGAALSGGEFLSALDAGKAGALGLRAQGDQNPGRQNGEGELGGKPSLRVIDGGGKGKAKAQFGEILEERSTLDKFGALTLSQSPTQMGGSAKTMGQPTPEVTGHVVQGANAEDRLSAQTLLGVTTGLREFATQGTGGEMRIRLRPENLGELHIRVVTDGKTVGLQVQATDDRAKKILEDSINSLKESMASQNLSLGSVDFTVGQAREGQASGGSADQKGQQSQQSFGQDMLGQQNAGGSFGSRSGREGWEGSGEQGGSRGVGASASARGAAQRGAIGAMGASALSGGRTASGRLDVRA